MNQIKFEKSCSKCCRAYGKSLFACQLPCGHCFCFQCVSEYHKRKNRLFCFVDGQKFDLDPTDLITPLFMGRILKEERKIHYFCSKHLNEELKYKCKFHDDLICEFCIPEHETHQDNIEAMSQDEIKLTIRRVLLNLDDLKRKIKEIKRNPAAKTRKTSNSEELKAFFKFSKEILTKPYCEMNTENESKEKTEKEILQLEESKSKNENSTKVMNENNLVVLDDLIKNEEEINENTFQDNQEVLNNPVIIKIEDPQQLKQKSDLNDPKATTTFYQNISLNSHSNINNLLKEPKLPLRNSQAFKQSSLLPKCVQAYFIHELFEEEIESTNLLFRAQKQGFRKFHYFCDNKGPTLLLATANNRYFGGYSSRSWMSSSRGEYKAAHDNFLFSLDQRTKHVIFRNGEFAIKCEKEAGPIFGKEDSLGFFDLKIGFKGKSSSHARLGLTYQSLFPYGSLKSNTFFAGTNIFKVDDYEVFSIKLKGK